MFVFNSRNELQIRSTFALQSDAMNATQGRK